MEIARKYGKYQKWIEQLATSIQAMLDFPPAEKKTWGLYFPDRLKGESAMLEIIARVNGVIDYHWNDDFIIISFPAKLN